MSAGKGDAPRPVDGERFRQNWDEIFLRKTQENLDMMSAFVHISPHTETPAATTPNDVEPAAHAN
jgi:hypothetical protein